MNLENEINMNLESITNAITKPDKPDMRDCRVFKVDVGNAAPSDVSRILQSCIEAMKEKYDTSHVIFVPVRGSEDATGWQD